jgi:hypothetical protein
MVVSTPPTELVDRPKMGQAPGLVLREGSGESMSSPEARSKPVRTPLERLGRQLRTLARPLPLFAALAVWMHDYETAPDAARRETDVARSLSLGLAKLGLSADPSQVMLLPDRTPRGAVTRHERALVLARRPGELADVYLVRARRSPEGNLLEISSTVNLTDTSAADEQGLVVNGEHAAWAVTQDGKVHAVQLADLTGEPRLVGREWTPWRRLQNALTNLQETRQWAGVGRRAFKLEPPASRVALGLTQDALLMDVDAHRVRVPIVGAPPEDPRALEQTPRKARPGNLVTWAVDRVRALPWFGDRNMQLLKAVAFEASDQLDQIVSEVSHEDASHAVAEELGELYAAPTSDETDPVTGWPPAPMQPMISPPLKGEGKWVRLEKDPFVARNPGAPAPFVFSFIRTDRKRIYSQIFVTLWDPRQLELHPVSGTVEPKSATGATGTGEIPRRPEVMGRLAGALNGGFQAMHGDFGMMADRVLYLPPKPYAATVALMADGSTGFGTWPEVGPVPKDMVSFRQNLTPLVVDEKPNPYKRYWWGGVPPGWTQETRTVRSAICMTRDGFIGYFYGASVDPDVLAVAMVRARCVYGIHLDMNAGHTGLELYRAAPKGQLPPIGHPLDDMWEARGPVPGMDGWEFVGRRMFRLMALMNFPRYIGTEQRDFFYLTLRPILPGEPVPSRALPAQPGEGLWRVQGLEQHGWPPAVATTRVRPDAARPDVAIGLIKLDPRLVRAPGPGETGAGRIIDFRTPAAAKDMSFALWHGPHTGFQITREPPEPQATRITFGYAGQEKQSVAATAALGIDAQGMLLYARVTEGDRPGSDGAMLRNLLTSLGCETQLFVPATLGAELAPPGAEPAVREPGSGVVLVRAEGPSVRRIFTDTPIVGPKRWAPLQTRRNALGEP